MAVSGSADHLSQTDESSGFPAHVSHFGVLKAGATYAISVGNFPGTALDIVQWQDQTENGASITVSDGMAQMSSGTNTAGSCTLRSRKNGLFRAGQVTVFQSGVRAGLGVADNIRIWGLLSSDGQEGIYFKWNGTTFQVVARKGGTETSVNSANFNGQADWSPVDSNNTYRIEYSAGRALFYRASGGEKLLLHSMVDTAEPLVNNLNLPLYYENTNSGNTSDVSMYVRGASSSVWGALGVFNISGAEITGDFGTEVALDKVSGYSLKTKFGRNPDIDTGTAPEDIWNGGGNYTGFNATANQNIEVFSSDVDDQGQVLSSGTATLGTTTTLTDSGATFVTDLVAAGDLLINDTRATHGVIASVDSETQVTVFRMVADREELQIANQSGDSYRIANANDTGAAVVKLSSMLNADYEKQDSRYVVLNGTTGVTVTGNYMRCPQGQVILAGSSGNNEGTITARQATTTANVFMVMPAQANRTAILAFTVDMGSVGLIKRVRLNRKECR
jgi:hypothetical protein